MCRNPVTLPKVVYIIAGYVLWHKLQALLIRKSVKIYQTWECTLAD